MQISDFDYALPDDLIARYPAAERRASRLLELGPAIVDRQFAELPDLLSPGDLLVFHSHLMHRSKDNESDGLRAAMVYHYAESGTVDRAGWSPVNDWMPVRASKEEAR